MHKQPKTPSNIFDDKLKSIEKLSTSTTLNKDKYIASQQPVSHHELTGRAGEDESTPAVTGGFRTLLGGIAYALITQFWIIVFAVALQRKTKCCQTCMFGGLMP